MCSARHRRQPLSRDGLTILVHAMELSWGKSCLAGDFARGAVRLLRPVITWQTGTQLLLLPLLRC